MEAAHTDLSEVTGMVLIDVGSVVVLFRVKSMNQSNIVEISEDTESRKKLNLRLSSFPLPDHRPYRSARRRTPRNLRRLTAVHPPPGRRLPRSAPTARATAAAPASAPLLGLARGWTAMVHAALPRERKGKPTARQSSYPSGPPTLEKTAFPPIILIS